MLLSAEDSNLADHSFYVESRVRVEWMSDSFITLDSLVLLDISHSWWSLASSSSGLSQLLDLLEVLFSVIVSKYFLFLCISTTSPSAHMKLDGICYSGRKTTERSKNTKKD
jgi:hypothetical protein